MRPATLRPSAELFAEKPHATRLRYLAGCRCVPCRAGNSRYSCERERMRRAGLANGLVDATRARRHVLRLSRMNVGYKTIAARTGISCSVLWKIRSGQRKIRALNEKRILEIGPRDARGTARKNLGQTAVTRWGERRG